MIAAARAASLLALAALAQAQQHSPPASAQDAPLAHRAGAVAAVHLGADLAILAAEDYQPPGDTPLAYFWTGRAGLRRLLQGALAASADMGRAEPVLVGVRARRHGLRLAGSDIVQVQVWLPFEGWADLGRLAPSEQLSVVMPSDLLEVSAHKPLDLDWRPMGLAQAERLAAARAGDGVPTPAASVRWLGQIDESQPLPEVGGFSRTFSLNPLVLLAYGGWLLHSLFFTLALVLAALIAYAVRPHLVRGQGARGQGRR